MSRVHRIPSSPDVSVQQVFRWGFSSWCSMSVFMSSLGASQFSSVQVSKQHKDFTYSTVKAQHSVDPIPNVHTSLQNLSSFFQHFSTYLYTQEISRGICLAFYLTTQQEEWREVKTGQDWRSETNSKPRLKSNYVSTHVKLIRWLYDWETWDQAHSVWFSYCKATSDIICVQKTQKHQDGQSCSSSFFISEASLCWCKIHEATCETMPRMFWRACMGHHHCHLESLLKITEKPACIHLQNMNNYIVKFHTFHLSIWASRYSTNQPHKSQRSSKQSHTAHAMQCVPKGLLTGEHGTPSGSAATWRPCWWSHSEYLYPLTFGLLMVAQIEL